MYSPIIAMLFGVLNTIILHIAKAMERHGIEVFDQIRAKLKNEGTAEQVEGTKKPTIYLIGLILNQTPFLWAMLSNMFSSGNASYYTSMFGLGLIALMFYSTKILHEKIQKIEYVGAAILIIGTLIIGVENINRPEPVMEMNLTGTWVAIIIFLIVGILGIIIAHKKNNPMLVGIVFGAVAGGCGAMDPFFKAIGQSWGVEGSGFLPDFTNAFAVIIFLVSFGVGSVAFWVTQWGFAKKSDASVLVPCYNSVYIVWPIILYLVAYPGEYLIFPTTILGLLLTITGIVLMQAFRKPVITQK